MEATEVVMERMSGRGGLIVNTASLAGFCDGDYCDYCDQYGGDEDQRND